MSLGTIKKKKQVNKEYLDRLRANGVLQEAQLRCVYNMTLLDYAKMYKEQGGCCAICGTPQRKLKKRLSVDHDHATDMVRGLLCLRCNVGLGCFEDNVEILSRAMSYLKGGGAKPK